MKLQFSVILKGEDGIESKFQESLKAHPNLHLDLIKSFGHAIMMAFRFDDKDNIVIEHFSAGKIQENAALDGIQVEQCDEHNEKKVDA